MAEEIKDSPSGRYAKMSTSQQRFSATTPLCARLFEDGEGTKICRGAIVNNICQRCGANYTQERKPLDI